MSLTDLTQTKGQGSPEPASDGWQVKFEKLLQANEELKEGLRQSEARYDGLCERHHELQEQSEEEKRELYATLSDYRSLKSPKQELGTARAEAEAVARGPQRIRYPGKLQKFKSFSLSHPYPEEWISEVRGYVISYFEDDREGVTFVLGLLERDVKTALKVRIQLDSVDLLTLMRELEALFGAASSTELELDFCHRIQGQKETVKEYAIALMELVVKLRVKDELSTDKTENMLKHQFAKGVLKPELRRELKRLNAEQPRMMFSQLMQKADDWLLEGTEMKRSSTCHRCSVPVKADCPNCQKCFSEPLRSEHSHCSVCPVETATAECEAETQVQFAFKSRVDRMEETLTKLIKKIDDLASEKKDSQKIVKECTFCGKRGHVAKDCYSRRNAEKRSRSQKETEGGTSSLNGNRPQ